MKYNIITTTRSFYNAQLYSCIWIDCIAIGITKTEIININDILSLEVIK